MTEATLRAPSGPFSANFNLMQYLNNITDTYIRKQIRNLRRSNLISISEEDLRKLIYRVLLDPVSNTFCFPICLGLYPEKTYFYRARKLSSSLLPAPEVFNEPDAWNAPAEICKRGRLNKENESLLYTTPGEPSVTFKEIGAKHRDFVSLFTFEAKEEIKAVVIPGHLSNTQFTRANNEKLEMLNDFLFDEFTRYVGAGTENLYRISELIAKDFFDLPPEEVQDAWCYPSIVSREHMNVCFRPDIGRKKLRLKGVKIGTVTENLDLDVEMVAILNSDLIFEYYPIGSEVQKIYFPEI
jgi:hypothetical protein